ncbi:MAG: guanylate kinase [Candidatus Saccharimonadales bacterium]
MEIDEALKRKVASYRPDPAKLDTVRHAPLMLMVGITGAGKNAVIHQLLERNPGKYYFLISHTSRAPRPNHGELEKDGVDYHFVQLPVIRRMLDNKEFIEAAVIHDSWISGSSIAEVGRAHARVAISDIDIQGAEHYMQLGLNAKPVFLLPPSFEVWEERFMKRGGGSIPLSELAARLQSAIREIEHALMQEYFYIVINDNLDKTVEVVNDIGQGKPVEPHYQKAMIIAEQLLTRLREELAKLT